MHWSLVVLHELLPDQEGLGPPMAILVKRPQDGPQPHVDRELDHCEVGQQHEHPEDAVKVLHVASSPRLSRSAVSESACI